MIENLPIHYLYTRAYMGHTVIDSNGKKLTWHVLRNMADANVNVLVEQDPNEPINKIFLIQK